MGDEIALNTNSLLKILEILYPFKFTDCTKLSWSKKLGACA